MRNFLLYIILDESKSEFVNYHNFGGNKKIIINIGK